MTSKTRLVKIYDTTLRDGIQAEDINFSVTDKIKIAQRMDEMGFHYIEGGWPGSNPKDMQFFKEIQRIDLQSSKIVAFGRTTRAGIPPENDKNIQALIHSKTLTVAIVGKSWDLHVTDALKISLNENLEIIHNSLTFLKSEVQEVFFDAEHFFDGFKANPKYSLMTLQSAQDTGVDCIILCDTNGGSMPFEIQEIIEEVRKSIKVPLGIHTHNDSEMAVANAIIAVKSGVKQIQGTINGYGERCGNANLCSVIPNLKLKLNIDCISSEHMKRLRELSRFVNELANLRPNKHQPYVGDSAFAHKGGIHVSAVKRNPKTYEHIKPELVGSKQRILISDLSGKSNIISKAAEFNIDLDDTHPATINILKNMKELENQGYQFEGAEASFEILMMNALKNKKKYFDLIGFRVIDQKEKENSPPQSEATIMVKVRGKIEHTAAVGNGPVNALDNALRKALEKFYPELKEMELIDYKVRVLSTGEGTKARVRVLIESGDKKDKWGTVGVSHDIIEASWQALVDSIDYKLLKDHDDS
ncbi:MAG: citramalate synthase [Thermodesulfobacteriota bacterium]|nr:citramalate synthase [Thermodesulfobacteriota bacterium]